MEEKKRTENEKGKKEKGCNFLKRFYKAKRLNLLKALFTFRLNQYSLKSVIIKSLYLKKEEIIMNISIRPEDENDFKTVENMTREAFWDLYKPRCVEHLILHNMKGSPDFVKELD